MFSRRGFIRAGAASVGSLALRPFGLLPALAQSSSNYKALVCVFLFGGNDANNMVIPMDDPTYTAYTSARAALALPTTGLTSTVYSTSGAPYAFHKAMPNLANLFSSKELGVIANVGSLVEPITRAQYQAALTPVPMNLFSHFDQQNQWQSSIAQGGSTTGWAGRVADYIESQKINSSQFPTFFSVAGNSLMGTGVTAEPVAISPGGSLTLAGFNTTAPSQARWNAMTNLLQFQSGVSLAQAANQVLSNSIGDATSLTNALAKGTKLKTVFPNNSLGQQLQQVAQVIQVASYLGMNRQIFFCSLGGFDTHTNELNQHNALYPQIDQAISAFYSATQELGMAQNVTTFTESDFCRTFQPTSGGGADHGWGSHQMVVGGAVQGGQIYGTFPTFELGGPSDTDTRGRWIPTLSIDQYGATLASWFGLPATAIATVFPNFANFASKQIGFFG